MRKHLSVLLIWLISAGPVAAQSVIGQSSQSSALVKSVGPDPYIDVTAYGARSISSFTGAPTTTATCTATSTACTLAASAGFQNGDGVVIYGAGATNSMSTPSSPTITPSSPRGATGTGFVVSTTGGGTSYSYKIVARDKNGGLTAASSAGSTSTGMATLGAVNYAVSTATRSGTTVTLNATVTQLVPAGSTVCYYGNSTDATFDGCWQVSSSTGSTIVFGGGPSTAAGAGSSATGGTAYVFFSNHITWPAVTGAFQYYVYGRTSGGYNLIGATLPGALDPGSSPYFDDYGSTMSAAPSLPSYVPSTAPGSATNDYLSTTISSGGGTTSVVLANAAGNSVSGATFLFDDVPGFVAAESAASYSGTEQGGLFHVPIATYPYTYYLNSVMTLPGGSQMWLSNNVIVNETMVFGNFSTFTGNLGNYFGSAPAQSIGSSQYFNIQTAYPGIHSTNSQGIVMNGISLTVKNQGIGAYISGGWYFTWKNSNCVVGTASGNYMGMCLAINSMPQAQLLFDFFQSSDPVVVFAHMTPIVWANGSGSIFVSHCHGYLRGMGFTNVNPIDIDDYYVQGPQTPLITTYEANGGATAHVHNAVNDTSILPIFSSYGFAPNLTLDGQLVNSADTAGFPLFVSGNNGSDVQPTTYQTGFGAPGGSNKCPYGSGCSYLRLDGGAGSTSYVYEAGSWVAK